MGCRVIMEVNLWPCLRETFYAEAGRPTQNVGSTTPQARVLDWIKAGGAKAECYHSFLLAS